VIIYPGNFAEYVRDQEEQAALGNGIKAAPVASAKPGTPVATIAQSNGASDPEAKTDQAKDKVRKLNPIKLKQMEDRCAFLEEEVPRIEASIAHTEGALGNFVSVAETERQSRLLEELRKQLADSTAEWEDLMMQLEEQAAHS
jgi:ATP-binding cassette subfamily F protein 3